MEVAVFHKSAVVDSFKIISFDGSKTDVNVVAICIRGAPGKLIVSFLSDLVCSFLASLGWILLSVLGEMVLVGVPVISSLILVGISVHLAVLISSVPGLDGVTSNFDVSVGSGISFDIDFDGIGLDC